MKQLDMKWWQLALVVNRTPLGLMSSEDLGEVRTRAKLNYTVRTQQSRLPCVKPATPARHLAGLQAGRVMN